MNTINPNILRWARETAGLTLGEAAIKLGLRDTNSQSAMEKLEKYEVGEIQTSKSLLQKMAKIYRRPLIIFYLEEIPSKNKQLVDYRKKDLSSTSYENGLMEALMRDMITRQSIVKDAILEDEENVVPLDFIGELDLSYSTEESAKIITERLGFDISIFRKYKHKNDSFRYLRICTEKIGVYVLVVSDLGNHHTSIRSEVFRGLTIADKIAPFIVLNSNDAKSAMPFTLLHEITHLFLNQSSISNGDINNVVERFCDNVAATILLSTEEFLHDSKDFPTNEDELIEYIGEYASEKNISATMVAYRLLQNNIINSTTYNSLAATFKNMWLSLKKSEKENKESVKGGPSFYVTKRHQNGANLLETTRGFVSDGSLSLRKAGQVLGVSEHNVYEVLRT